MALVKMTLTTLRKAIKSFAVTGLLTAGMLTPAILHAAQTDLTQTPNVENAGITKSLQEEIGAGRGDVLTEGSSAFIISRDPFRAIRRGRQLFQRKFTTSQGVGPRTNDGVGNIAMHPAIGAGSADSCAACHGQPKGSGGVGGSVATRPDSRDAPHLFGLGLVEQLGDEITADLRAIRAQAITSAHQQNAIITVPLVSKAINYGSLTVYPDGALDTAHVVDVNPDLRVRPFFAQGKDFSIREFIVGAFKDEMGLEAVDPDIAAAHAGGRVVTPSGLVLDGAQDSIPTDPTTDPYADPDEDGKVNEIPQSLVDHLEFYLLNYFKPGTYKQTVLTKKGLKFFKEIGCNACHIQTLVINHDRRVGDVNTVYDPVRGIFNNLFATGVVLPLKATDDGSGFPTLKKPAGQPFVVNNIFADFKRHDLGPNFWERNFDGSFTKLFMTEPLWGVGTTAPYGHDGRSTNLEEVILRHGGEAQTQRDAFAGLGEEDQQAVVTFLRTLVLFPPDDTASNLDPGNRNNPNFPQRGHGSIRLPVLFNNPAELE